MRRIAVAYVQMVQVQHSMDPMKGEKQEILSPLIHCLSPPISGSTLRLGSFPPNLLPNTLLCAGLRFPSSSANPETFFRQGKALLATCACNILVEYY